MKEWVYDSKAYTNSENWVLSQLTKSYWHNVKTWLYTHDVYSVLSEYFAHGIYAEEKDKETFVDQVVGGTELKSSDVQAIDSHQTESTFKRSLRKMQKFLTALLPWYLQDRCISSFTDQRLCNVMSICTLNLGFCLLVNCFKSQRHASVSQGPIWQLHILPQWDRSCKSNSTSLGHRYWHQA